MILSQKAADIKPSSTLAITAKAKQMKADGIDVVGFGAGEPDFDTPDHIKAAAVKAMDDGFTKYTPASGIPALKAAICKKLADENGVTYATNQIVVSNGAKHSLTNTFMAILNPSDEVIIPGPFWLSYKQMVKIADGVPVIVRTKKENHYKATIDELEGALTNKTKALLINSPSNPTGMVYTEEELREIADFVVKHNLYVVSDEIYEKLIYGNEKHVSIASFNEEIYKRTIMINGVSKTYAMTGWRIGYAAAPADIAKIMSNIQSHASSNPNSLAQKAALAAISGPQECVQMMKAAFNKRRDYMYERIAKMPYISAIKPQGAFYLFVDLDLALGKSYKDEVIDDANTFAKLILDDQKVAVVPCTDFGYSTHFRLSYASSMENIQKGLDRMEAFLNNLQ
ncbi:pyridoxal phosphate-dependent aminotransferase [Vallitalea pronyensis]|uniref:Aminotransferase n=1 Tax=Vallitalea pronyensis TaxID=1348613 RepID=A0A8J8MKR8_9FIRM|nr:pyridoxal phosphate-dependent aminotransferase [Vallitalea pronyensis]QUI23048.1 pyridoxal phosphate-dependent aminotransferase [Vallitalea pronyensis]